MAGNVLGLIATIDVTDLKAGLSQAKRAINQTKQDFESATSTMENWQKCSEGVGAKLEQLKNQFAIQEKVIEAYQNAIKKASEKEGDHSAQVEILKAKLEKAQTTLNKTKTQIEKYSATFEELKEKEELENSANSKLLQGLEDNRKKLQKLENQYKSAVKQHGKYSTEARKVASEVKKTTKEIKSQEGEVEKLAKSYKTLTDKSSALKDIGSNFSSAFSGLQSLGSQIKDFFTNASNETQKLNENSTRLNTVFKDVGLSTQALESNYSKLYGVIGDDDKVSEALTYLAQLGVSEEDLGKYTESLIGVYAKFGNSMPINQMAQNINEAIKTANVTGQLGNAIKQVGVDEEKFKSVLSNLATEEERQQLILKTLNKNYTELGEEYQKNNQASIESNNAQKEYNDTLKGFGEIGENLTTILTEFKTNALQAIYPVVSKIFNFVNQNIDVLTQVATGILAIGGAIKTVTAISKAVSTIGSLFASLSNPVGQAMVAIAAVATIATVIIKNWDKVKSFFVNLWDSIKSIFENIKDKLTDALWFATLPTLIIKNWDEIKEFFVNFWDSLKSTFEDIKNKLADVFSIENIVKALKELPSKVASFFTQAWESVKRIWNNPGEFFTEVVDKIVDVFKTLPSKIADLFRRLGEAIIKWCKNVGSNIWNAITGKGEWGDILKLDIEAEANTDVKFKSDEKKTEEAITKYCDNLTEEVEEKVKEKPIEINASVEVNSLDDQSATAQKFLAKIQDINKRFDESFSTTHTTEELAKLKESYVNEIGAIQKEVDEHTELMGDALDEVNEQLDTTRTKVNSASLSITDKFKETMSSVSSVASKIGSKISSWSSAITSVMSNYWQTEMDNLDNYYDQYCETLEKEQKAYEENINTLNAEDEEKRADELEANAEQYRQGLIDEKTYYKNKNAINEKYNNTQKKREADLTAYNEEQAKAKEQTEKELLDQKNELARKQFIAEKVNNIAQVWIQAALAIVKAFATLGPIGGAISAAVITTLAGVQTAAIAKEQFTPYTALAEGGVVDKPTNALVGEAGAEVVMPLKNNTEWIEELANKLNSLMQKDLDINNYQATPSGAVYYTGDTINNYNYEQTINSPSALTRKEIYKDSKNLLSLKKYN